VLSILDFVKEYAVFVVIKLRFGRYKNRRSISSGTRWATSSLLCSNCQALVPLAYNGQGLKLNTQPI